MQIGKMIAFAAIGSATLGISQAYTFYGVTLGANLVTFDSASPGTFNSSVGITGLQSGERFGGSWTLVTRLAARTGLRGTIGHGSQATRSRPIRIRIAQQRRGCWLAIKLPSADTSGRTPFAGKFAEVRPRGRRARRIHTGAVR